MTFEFEPIGIVRSCYKEKFGIPRQPGLVPDAPAAIELFAPYNGEEAVHELTAFSHLWILFVFHKALNHKWKATVRPPRLGGNRRIGVFASRSPFRPNPIGISAVERIGLEKRNKSLYLHIKGADLLDTTPVLDIKPYLPYADAIPHAISGYAPSAPSGKIPVIFSDEASAACRKKQKIIPNLKTVIEQIIGGDPRPAYLNSKHALQEYGCKLFDFDLKWKITEGRAVVIALEDI